MTRSENIIHHWSALKGKARERWGKLTHDDLERIEGRRDQLAARLTELYGLSAAEVDRELEAFAAQSRVRGEQRTDKGTGEPNES